MQPSIYLQWAGHLCGRHQPPPVRQQQQRPTHRRGKRALSRMDTKLSQGALSHVDDTLSQRALSHMDDTLSQRALSHMGHPPCVHQQPLQ
eukprot:349715-Chlamydomonas_euryale.AAC.5